MNIRKNSNIITGVRKIIKNGGSFYIALPQKFIKSQGLKAGDHLVVIVSQDETVKVVSMS